jgi:hypothetical protein
MIVLGIFLAFFGNSLIPIAVFLVATLMTTGLILIVLYSFILGPSIKTWLTWMIVSLSLLIGLIVGILLARTRKLYAVIVAAFAGFLTGVLLNEAVLYLAKSKILFWSVNVGLTVLCALLALVWFNSAILLSTSLVGSYLTVRGVSLFAGGFPNEYTLID